MSVVYGIFMLIVLIILAIIFFTFGGIKKNKEIKNGDDQTWKSTGDILLYVGGFFCVAFIGYAFVAPWYD